MTFKIEAMIEMDRREAGYNIMKTKEQLLNEQVIGVFSELQYYKDQLDEAHQVLYTIRKGLERPTSSNGRNQWKDMIDNLLGNELEYRNG